MFNEFNSWLFYLGVFGGSAYLLGFIKENQNKRTFFALAITLAALALPILTAAYRCCGSDTLGYLKLYIRTRRIPWEQIVENIEGLSEVGHTFLTKFLGYFKSVRIYLGTYAAITVGLFYLATKKIKYESLPLVMLLFYFGTFGSTFNIMRQGIAIALVAYAYTFVFKKNFKKFIVFILLASLFHLSAFVAVFTYFVWTKNNKTISKVILFAATIAVVLIAINLDSVLGVLENREFESASIQRYVGYGNEVDVEFKNRDFYLNLLLAVIMMTHYSRLVKVDGKNAFLIFLFYISVALGLCGFINPFAKRISMYFGITSHWVLADIPKCYKDHVSVWTARLLVIFYAIIRFTITAYILGGADLIPYIWVIPSWARL